MLSSHPLLLDLTDWRKQPVTRFFVEMLGGTSPKCSVPEMLPFIYAERLRPKWAHGNLTHSRDFPGDAKGVHRLQSRSPGAEIPEERSRCMVCRSAEGELEEYKRRQAKLHVGQHHFIGPDCFDILTNRYRLVTAVDFEKGILWIKWIGTHKEYDKIDVKRVKHGRR
jgi:hypothetical protein